jgi:hypothetical protein
MSQASKKNPGKFKDAKFNENFLEQRKKQHLKKYSLDKSNIYDAIFTLVNKRLKSTVELHMQKKLIGEAWNPNYSVDNYSNVYKMITDYLMKMIRNSEIKDDKMSSNLELIKKIKIMNFDDILAKA